MEKGWIIYNGNLTTEKFMYQINWLEQAGRDAGFEIVSIKNNELIVTIEDGKSVIKGPYGKEIPDFVFFWDKDLSLARHLEKVGLRLFNSSRTIEICDDKSLTSQILADHNIRMPKTVIAPMVYSEICDFSMYKYIVDELGFPLVIKEAYGSFGEQVYLVHNEVELIEKIKALKNKKYIIQEFIQSSYGRDIRLNVVGNKVVAAMQRKSESDFRANITAGGKTYEYEPSEEEKKLAVRCSQLVGADFSGVDLLFGEDGKPVLCEINSNSHFKTIYDCTGIDVAEYMMRYIKEELSKGE
ncbi:RimK family alpha-L-glutamate ligase [Evansella vedderi]|uniref:RimK family alpha-L-glutamate ligase n=1 Tax=Evansella vedderi TaxID=38282 RepID=A0ABT9ZVA5_9BACI|nr:RimK family alpha-L-glutamate ligase [Evansella vedderi]MDQ0254667.1 RimK family alpha-L-glutamate ligase [Evansella vedderi]